MVWTFPARAAMCACQSLPDPCPPSCCTLHAACRIVYSIAHLARCRLYALGWLAADAPGDALRRTTDGASCVMRARGWRVVCGVSRVARRWLPSGSPMAAAVHGHSALPVVSLGKCCLPPRVIAQADHEGRARFPCHAADVACDEGLSVPPVHTRPPGRPHPCLLATTLSRRPDAVQRRGDVAKQPHSAVCLWHS